MLQDEHLAAKDDPACPQPEHKVIHVLALACLSQPVAAVVDKTMATGG